ncbi:MAG: hypothetical protein M3355_04535 [Actinomycetota bacterium]|nr:hypothetical protein [Actinomycetota bacterium]
MPGTIRSHIRSNVVAYVALFFALGGGVAYAAIDSGDIKNDAVKVRDLNFPVGGDGVTTAEKVNLSPKAGFTTVAKTTLGVDDKGGSAVAQAAVELTNNSGESADVVVRLIHQGHPEHTANFTTTVPAGGSQSTIGAFVCDGFPAGDQTILLKLSGPASVSVGQRTLAAQVVPEI